MTKRIDEPVVLVTHRTQKRHRTRGRQLARAEMERLRQERLAAAADKPPAPSPPPAKRSDVRGFLAAEIRDLNKTRRR